MKQERQGDQDVWTAGSTQEVEDEGWKILMLEDWKPGVARLHCVNGHEFRMVYVKTSVASGSGALVVCVNRRS